jgi:hypothetical protein
MKKEMKDKINAPDPIVREKLIKRLAAERIANKHDLEINFNEIKQEDYIDEITKARISKEKNLSEIQKKALLVKLSLSKLPQNVIDEMNSKNLEFLLKNIQPKLNEGDYVFCSIKNMSQINSNDLIGSFKEAEGFSIIISKAYADANDLFYSCIMSWISLEVNSALESVGLTAAFSNTLANNNISCNVVAGYYHDHIFVMKEDSSKAMELLKDFNK